MAYPTEVVWSSTWNRELAEEGGRLIGEDSLSSGVTVWYAPAMNIHRSPFSGRNFEYYSEDGFLSAEIGAAEVSGAKEKGVIVTLKHFALNDQETNRSGVLVFANEQSVRQLYLRGFEGAVREGNANGVMVSMNRIGARWTGGHAGLMTETLRNEWGFVGLAVTDQASFPDCAIFDLREGLEAGTDLWLNTSTAMWNLSDEEVTPAVMTNLHRAAKNVVYTIANSNAMNGISEDATVTKTMRTWNVLVILLSIILAILAMLSIYRAMCCFGFRKAIREKKKEEKKQRRLEKKNKKHLQ
jgi:beta-glucosidase